jgi:hypothetical protein
MAGAVGIVFGLCVLSFTLGAALMYVLVRRREDAAPGVSSASDAPVERTWVEKPATVEPVDDSYDTRPIHRNPVMGLRQLEPALASPAEPEPVAEVAAEPEQIEEVAAEPVAEVVAEPVVEVVAEPPAEELVEEPQPEPEPDAEPELTPPVAQTELPPPASPQPVEHTTWVEREDFRQRYLRTFEEARRKADSN